MLRFEFDAAHPMYSRWKPYRGRYPDPTAKEFMFIEEYLRTFNFEKDDWVESDGWREVAEKLGFPNLRQKLLEHLHLIRESKGYDVVHDFVLFAPFDPCAAFKDEEHIRQSEEARKVAIATINSQMMHSGKRYEFVKLDKCVWNFQRLSYLMTLIVKEVKVDGDDDVPDADADADDSPTFRAIRAMVYSYFTNVELTEWKFKY